MNTKASGSAAGASASARAPAKVLFFSHDAKLGDAIVNTAFVAGLRRYAPDCAIDATVAGSTGPFWGADARIARRWTLQRPGWIDIVRTGLALRRERYDFIVTWKRVRSERNRLLLWLARPRALVDLHDFARGPVRHQIEACRAALEQVLGRRDVELAYALPPYPACARLDALLPAGQEVIVVNLFAADAERSIAPAEAGAILRGLRRLAPDAQVCLVCTEATRAAASDALNRSGASALLVECDLGRLMDLCRRADLVISPDTAVVHIASALERPVIGIYQNNGVKALQWGPRSRLHAVVLSASGDSIHGFSVTQVLRHARRLRELARQRPAAA